MGLRDVSGGSADWTRRLRPVSLDGRTQWELHCPGCSKWALIDDDQLHGRISVWHLTRLETGSDGLVIVKEDGEWQLSPRGWHVLNAAAAFGVPTGSVGILDALAAAQEGEKTL